MDTGLHTLVAIARFHQLPAEPEQLAHQYGVPGEAFSDTQILQAAKALTLKAKKLKPATKDISNGMLPAIAKATDGSYFILARIANNEEAEQGQKSGVLIQDLRDEAPKSLTLDEFTEMWSGELIALTR